MKTEDGKLKPTKYMCLTCRKPFEAIFLMKPIVKGECAACYMARTDPRRKRSRRNV